MSLAFTLDKYRRMIGGLLALGYEVRGFTDALPERRHLILRHDIDLSPAHAAMLAEVEASMGLAATYFVLVRSELYNPFSPRSAADLRRIIAAGHTLGLHLDASLYADLGNLEAGAKREVEALERFFGVRIETVSLHRPARHLLGGVEHIAGCVCAYARRYFVDMGYCSDSRGEWHHGEPAAHPAVRAGRALQLLTHPIWWVGEAAEPELRLRRHLDECIRALDRDLAANCKIHVTGQAHK
jgi:hypothetical protein